MAEVTTHQAFKVFVSYSRRDAVFADRLVDALKVRGFDVLIDRQNLPKLEDWERELLGFIRQADTIVFIVSPHSLASKVVGWEIEQVRLHAKRLAPVVIADVEGIPIPKEIARINYLLFTDTEQFEQSVDELAHALNSDVDWLKEHTRLGELARRWQEEGRSDDALIRGRELDAADAWAARRPKEAPVVSEMHRQFLAASRAGQADRLKREREQIARTQRFQTRAACALAVVAALVVVMLAGALWQQYATASREINIFTARAVEALREEQYDRAIRYALQAYPARGSVPLLTPFSTELEGKLAGAAMLSRLRLTLRGHTSAISHTAFSPDGHRVLTASYDGTARVWHAEKGIEIALLKGHSRGVTHASFSPDGARVVTASYDGTARVWDTATGTQIAMLKLPIIVLKGYTDTVASVYLAKFSRDGSLVLTISSDSKARLWEAASGKEIAVLDHKRSINDASFSPNGLRVVTASSDDTARLWDVEAKKETVLEGPADALPGREPAMMIAQFSPDGLHLVTVSRDGTARMWDAVLGKQVAIFEGHTDLVTSIGFSRDGSRIVTGSADSTARIWDAKSGKEIALFEGHAGAITSVSFSPDDAQIVSASVDKTVRLWDAESGAEIVIFKAHQDAVRSASFSPDGNLVLTRSDDGTIRTWEAVNRLEIAVLKGHSQTVRKAGFNADASRVLTEAYGDTVRLWDALNGKEIAILKANRAAFSPDGRRVVSSSISVGQLWDAESGAHIAAVDVKHEAVTSVWFSPDFRNVVTRSWDRTARLLDIVKGNEMAILADGESDVRAAWFSPDGKLVLTASEDRAVHVWDVTIGTIIPLDGHEAYVQRAGFSRDSRRIVTASRDKTARVWDAKSGKVLAVLKTGEGEPGSAGFSPDGRWVVISGRTTKVWDAASGKEAVTLRGHDDYVEDAAFSPDGRRLVTASVDHTARIWDAKSGKEIAGLKGHKRMFYNVGVTSAMFSHDGHRIVTASSDRTARVWDVTWATQVFGNALRERVCSEKLIGAQEFTPAELEDPILRGIDKDDPVSRNPCLRRGPLSGDYWVRLPGDLWRAIRTLSFGDWTASVRAK